MPLGLRMGEHARGVGCPSGFSAIVSSYRQAAHASLAVATDLPALKCSRSVSHNHCPSDTGGVATGVHLEWGPDAGCRRVKLPVWRGGFGLGGFGGRGPLHRVRRRRRLGAAAHAGQAAVWEAGRVARVARPCPLRPCIESRFSELSSMWCQLVDGHKQALMHPSKLMQAGWSERQTSTWFPHLTGCHGLPCVAGRRRRHADILGRGRHHQRRQAVRHAPVPRGPLLRVRRDQRRLV